MGCPALLHFVVLVPRLSMCSLKQSHTSMEDLVDIYHALSQLFRDSGCDKDDGGEDGDGEKRVRRRSELAHVLEISAPVTAKPGLLWNFQDQFERFGVALEFEYICDVY